MFTKQVYIPCLVCIMAFLRLLGTTVVFGTALGTVSLASYEVKWAWLINSFWTISAVTDMLITATLVTVLVRERTSALKRYAFLFAKYRGDPM
jgi:hypothetical protein